MTIKVYSKHYAQYKNVYILRSVESTRIMRNLCANAESPNQPVISWPSIWFLTYIGLIEFGLTLSLLIAFIFRLFCL